MSRAFLALEDGRVFEGTGFGANVTATGEACFNTSMTGYQEILTDPSYRGQIIAMTYPTHRKLRDQPGRRRGDRPHVRGFVIEELAPLRADWRSQESLDAYLTRSGHPRDSRN